ncbi:MAG: hypothetical protein L6V87_01655 [Ruminococcus sp.]|nr:MAG: hypothetical protein L6V87_01655 [Ruminococcus sp.]
MAYVKHTAIHTTPKAHLKYILNPEKKMKKMKYVTGICCGDDLETAYDNFKEIFEKSTMMRISIIVNLQRKAESGISVFIRTRSHSTAPFLPKKHIA